MRRLLDRALYFAALYIFYSNFALAARPVNYYALISTQYGSSIVKLYNQTPHHRDNFVKLVTAGKYNGLLFHRVIKGFMIQGGDPDSRNADTAKLLGDGDVGYTVPAEINDSLYHKKYVLAAARDDRHDKASSGIQFYLVQGKIFSEQQLADVEQKRLKHRLPETHREVYKSIGGAPHLDGNYTVYGEIVFGGEMVDRIAAVPTNSKDRPLVNVPMNIKMLGNAEVRRLERHLRALHKLADIKV